MPIITVDALLTRIDKWVARQKQLDYNNKNPIIEWRAISCARCGKSTGLVEIPPYKPRKKEYYCKDKWCK